MSVSHRVRIIVCRTADWPIIHSNACEDLKVCYCFIREMQDLFRHFAFVLLSFLLYYLYMINASCPKRGSILWRLECFISDKTSRIYTGVIYGRCVHVPSLFGTQSTAPSILSHLRQISSMWFLMNIAKIVLLDADLTDKIAQCTMAIFSFRLDYICSSHNRAHSVFPDDWIGAGC